MLCTEGEMLTTSGKIRDMHDCSVVFFVRGKGHRCGMEAVDVDVCACVCVDTFYVLYNSVNRQSHYCVYTHPRDYYGNRLLIP